MDYLRIRNWDKYQKTAGDKAPYVTIQTDILLDMEFMGLPDKERLCFLLLLAYAGRASNKIPNDASMLMYLCHFDEVPDLSLMMSRGLLEEWDEAKHAQMIEKNEEKRAYERRRKRQWRQSRDCPDDVPVESRLQTETETETKTTSSNLKRFDEFWAAYPKKVEKKKAKQLWKSRKLDGHADQIIADVTNRTKKDGKWLAGYVPNPTTYIRGDRWEDEMQPRTNGGRVPPESDAEGLRTLAEQHGIDWKRSNSYFDLRRAISQATGMPL